MYKYEVHLATRVKNMVIRRGTSRFFYAAYLKAFCNTTLERFLDWCDGEESFVYFEIFPLDSRHDRSRM